jgi:hypothetical protein
MIYHFKLNAMGKTTKGKLLDFKMTIPEAVSYIKARTCHLEFLSTGNYHQSLRFNLRKALNGGSFILAEDGPNGMELFIKVDGWSVQQLIEAFDLELSKESRERGILQRDLNFIKFKPKQYTHD